MAVQYLPRKPCPPLRHLPSHSMSLWKQPPISTAQPSCQPHLPSITKSPIRLSPPSPFANSPFPPLGRPPHRVSAPALSTASIQSPVTTQLHPPPPSPALCITTPSSPNLITNPSSAADDLIARPALTFSNTTKRNACLWQVYHNIPSCDIVSGNAPLLNSLFDTSNPQVLPHKKDAVFSSFIHAEGNPIEPHQPNTSLEPYLMSATHTPKPSR
jgi:hypothetical protein